MLLLAVNIERNWSCATDCQLCTLGIGSKQRKGIRKASCACRGDRHNYFHYPFAVWIRHCTQFAIITDRSEIVRPICANDQSYIPDLEGGRFLRRVCDGERNFDELGLFILRTYFTSHECGSFIGKRDEWDTLATTDCVGRGNIGATPKIRDKLCCHGDGVNSYLQLAGSALRHSLFGRGLRCGSSRQSDTEDQRGAR